MTSLFADPSAPASSAKLSSCGLYRYELRRRWGSGRPMAFIGLNPSTADATEDDPTIRRCVGFAKREGCDELVMLNLYAARETDPIELTHVVFGSRRVRHSACGPDNNHAIAAVLVELQNRNGVLVAAWGATDAALHRDRVEVVRKLVGAVPLMCFGTTKDGSPRHPLYLRGDAPLVNWSPR